ncbi:S9 family peptidase [Hirschia baltica]|uniref:Oligopeptidase B n=1 Tax=Hirschia baltica (strain ATCC 49814 / DSM 5838 / IFAM 1418) TaxID=582402 RepID=C6XI80_HIRBI|nr:Oligopeptidase B [Hirschia baltica ATCC 49814]
MVDQSSWPTPPIAQRIDKVTEQVGRTRTDPYAWIRDDNWQEVMQTPSVLKQDIRDYIEAENAFTKEVLETPTTVLQTELFEEMKGRIKEDDSSVPMIDGEWAYYHKFREGGEYPVYARKPAATAFTDSSDSDEVILLDGDLMGDGLEYFDFGQVSHSPDHSKIAYTVDNKGSEFYTLRVKDLNTGEELDTVIENTYGSFTWGADSNSLYWIDRNENNRPEKIFFRKLGEATDALVFHEKDSGYFLGVSRSQSDAFIFIRTGDHTTSEYHYIRADSDKPTQYHTIAPRSANIEYDVIDYNDQFFIKTNADGAVDFKIMSAPYDSSSRENWTEVVPHEPGTLISSISALKDWLIVEERKDALPRLSITSRETGDTHEIAFEEEAYDISSSTGYEYDTDTIRLYYASPTTPDQTHDYNIETREKTLLKTREIPSGHTPSDYIVNRVMAPAHDGESIPVTILRHKDTPLDGSAPLLLYGYGSYGITIDADFRSGRLSLVDRGFVYAIAHIRGSQAKGYQWYLDGKREKKTNTFKDYISAGEYLIDQNYTSKGKIVGMGGSAGGLLMGAVSNMAPDLFAGIIAAVPFVDVINTMSDTELPLTPPEWPEWGNPIKSSEDYDTILAYSPYDNITDSAYPTMLITGGLTDPRVTYWEPTKWVAALRHEAPNAGPYFLRINMGAGHGGASGRFEGLKETAIEYAFALASVGKAGDTLDLSK